MDMLIVEDDRPVFPADPLTSLRSRIKYDEVYEDEVIPVLHINERYNIYADRHGGNLHFNPVVIPGSSPGSSGACSYEGFKKLMHYEPGMVR
ncbi:MAG: hypothetical protein GKC07_05625 [Methanomicrobiales archaeon]|nr:hypothetical protein [Methanomicrobiales archaeon]